MVGWVILPFFSFLFLVFYAHVFPWYNINNYRVYYIVDRLVSCMSCSVSSPSQGYAGVRGPPGHSNSITYCA